MLCIALLQYCGSISFPLTDPIYICLPDYFSVKNSGIFPCIYGIAHNSITTVQHVYSCATPSPWIFS